MRSYQEDYLIMGDLEEAFHAIHSEKGGVFASLWFWIQVFGCFPRYFSNLLYWRIMMLNNYFKIAFRNLWKHKSHSVINIVGLTVSLALGFLLLQVIQTFYIHDEFHENKDRIYRIITHRNDAGREDDYASAPLSLATKLSDECPGIERVVRMKRGLGGYASYQSLSLYMGSICCDSEFFKTFSFELTAGDPSTALEVPNSIVLTQEMAERFFGTMDPLGKVIHWGDYGDFTVTGVLNDAQDYHSHIHLQPLVSWTTLTALEKQDKIQPYDRWDHIQNHYIYFMLEEHVPVSQVSALLSRNASEHYRDKDYTISFHIQSLRDILPGRSLKNHLGTTMPIIVVYLVWGLAIVIVMTAGFNYTNLTLAKALMRAREVGIRKVVGAKRSQIFVQLIGEAVLISVISLILAYVLYRIWLKPSFLNLHPALTQFFVFKENVKLLFYFLGFAVLTGISAGFLPAIYMSKFEPLKILRGFQNIRLFSKITLQKTLLVSQFTISLIFIIITVISLIQIRYLRRVDKGFQGDHMVNIEMRGVDYSLFRQRISQNASITGISSCDYLPGTSSTLYIPVRIDLASDSLFVASFSVDRLFIDNLGMKMIAGQDFGSGSVDMSSSVIINESFAERLGWAQTPDAIGETIYYGDGTPVQIIGVVRDFSQSALDRSLMPCIIRFIPEIWQQINVGLHPLDMKKTLIYLENVWKELYPDTPFKYAFYNDQIEEDVISMVIMMKVLRFVALLTVFVSCLGIFGIADYHSRTKTKEIGIRKVLGAGEGQIIRMLSKEFVVILMIAILIAVPLSHLLNQFYLQLYERQVPLRLTYYLLGVFMILLMGMGSIVTQTMRAARGKPMEALRYE